MSIDINVLGGTNHSFMNERCSADDSCGLRKFDVREEKCEMPPYKKMSEFFYYTDAFISAKVAPGYANDFSIVQFARGCRWTRYQRSDGTFNMYTDWNKKEFTVIPVGNREEPAHILDKGDYLRILSYGSYFNAKDRIPGVVDGVSYNTAFAFKTCIYKTADVDRELAAKKRYQDMAPLACIDWDSVFVYDFTTHQIREGGDIDAFCGWK